MQSSNGTNHTLERKSGIKFFTKQSLSLSNTPQFFMFFFSRLTHSASELSAFTNIPFTNNEREISIPYEVDDCGIENFEFIISERVQLNPDNSRAMSVLTFLLFKLNTLQTEIVKL